MYPRSMFEQKLENIIIFQLKIIIFAAVKSRSILHGRDGRVCVMISDRAIRYHTHAINCDFRAV